MHYDYIKQYIPNPEYSIFFSRPSITNGAGLQELEEDLTQQGARAILLHHVIVQCKATSLAPLQLVNHLGTVLMSFQEQIEYTGLYRLNFVNNSGLLKLTLTGSVGLNVRFTAMYQFVQDKGTITA